MRFTRFQGGIGIVSLHQNIGQQCGSIGKIVVRWKRNFVESQPDGGNVFAGRITGKLVGNAANDLHGRGRRAVQSAAGDQGQVADAVAGIHGNTSDNANRGRARRGPRPPRGAGAELVWMMRLPGFAGAFFQNDRHGGNRQARDSQTTGKVVVHRCGLFGKHQTKASRLPAPSIHCDIAGFTRTHAPHKQTIRGIGHTELRV